MADGKYMKAKVLVWWKDNDFNEYESIIEVHGEWRLLSLKVVEHG